MTRRAAAGAAALSLILCVPGGACSRRVKSTAPAATAGSLDVVLVTVDTLRADAPGFAGNGRVKTPVMDRLADRGRVFDDAHAHNVVTLPSHTNILTGLLPFQHGVRDNAGMTVPAGLESIATRLKRLGYATGAFVAAFPLDRRFGLFRGFDVYDDHYGKGTDPLSFRLAERPGKDVVAAALAWFNAQPAGRRFLWVHVFEPHAPYAPPAPFAETYRDTPYLGEVATADAALAPLLDGLAAPTLVVLTADHGESLGEHGEATHGLFAYEATLHVPLVLAGPGVRPGRDARLARHIDIVPTLLASVGAPPDPALPGRSLLAEPEAGLPSYFESLSAQLNRGWAPLTGVLRGSEKYVDLPVRELYDLASDPKELTNLAPGRDASVRDLARLVPAAARKPVARNAPSAEEAARLRSLGYVVSTAAPAEKTYGPDDDPKSLVAVDGRIHHLVDLYERGQINQAIDEGESLLRGYPTLTVAAEHLAFLYQQAERHDDAIRVLRGCLDDGRGSDAIRIRLGMVLAEAGRAKEALAYVTPLASSVDPDALNALGIALADSGAFEKANTVFERARALDPESPVTSMNLGIAALKEGKLDDARAALGRAVTLNPSLPAAWNALGAVEAKQGNVDAALAAWAKVVTLVPDDVDALYNLGMTAAKNGRNEAAGAALRRFVGTAPAARYAREIGEARQLLGELGRP